MAEADASVITTLNRRIEELTGENARRKRAQRAAAEALKAAEARAAELEAASAGALERAAALEKAAAALPGEQRAEIERLRGELLVRDRKSAFARAAGSVRPDALDDAFERVRWGDSGILKEDELAGEVARVLAERPYLAKAPDGAESDAGGSGGSAPVPRPPGPGSDRGRAVPTTTRPVSRNGRLG